MKFESRRVNELTTSDREAWGELRKCHPAYRSPLFSLALMELVEHFRGNIFVGVVRDHGEVTAMMPYCLVGATAHPFAGPLCDIQAVLTAGGEGICVRDMLKGFGLSATHFNAHVVERSPLKEFCYKTEVTPYIDLSNGFDAYREERRRAKSDELKESLRKGRKIEREIGPLKFDAICDDPAVFHQVLEWKSAQLSNSKRFNGLSVPWVRKILEAVVGPNANGCDGMVCALRVNGELAAGAIAIREADVLHGWVMAYNPSPKFRKYSPGILLLTQLLQACESIGVSRVDMGRGDEGYKKSFRSGGFEVGEGSVDLYALRGAMRRGMISMREWLGQSTLKNIVQSWVNRRRYASAHPRSSS